VLGPSSGYFSPFPGVLSLPRINFVAGMNTIPSFSILFGVGSVLGVSCFSSTPVQPEKNQNYKK
jgi:hypothetical protein